MKKIFDELYETYVRKNADYGDAFGVSLNKRGLVAALVRMDSLKDKEAGLVDESLEDTAMDLANYAAMTALWLRKERQIRAFNNRDQKALINAKDIADSAVSSVDIHNVKVQNVTEAGYIGDISKEKIADMRKN